ncbi:hypothetical protein SAMN05443144_11798 [Fodinibius roseus]|uniref:Uncharacterized protein n=1 Tax=Fodinibius roseus TaxID=1194090 RepID=A0A1M5GM67_9BACT|nr:hypothetical protein [Fodinibius roseus]SHG04783.1 hypothetical protein SAMN05443144_11798 [Fodinibius roseus]
MKSFTIHLRKLVRINRKIIQELHRDETSVASLREAFDKRALHSRKMGELISDVNKDMLSDEESAVIQTLFDQFRRQSKKIQDALDVIIDRTRERLGDAVNQRRAEKGYQSLK